MPSAVHFITNWLKWKSEWKETGVFNCLVWNILLLLILENNKNDHVNVFLLHPSLGPWMQEGALNPLFLRKIPVAVNLGPIKPENWGIGMCGCYNFQAQVPWLHQISISRDDKSRKMRGLIWLFHSFTLENQLPIYPQMKDY